ncbi:PE-PPE domain-containing protein [Mycobacterium sp.]|uniref:PE-PPE domain-containing protein n=1 Tax=Mycobacterium sp. TaxID=1785 RepID=UPI00127C4C04|nr:PE-PPE domain-containing protein [Mycobacterium sp.]KAA8967044.1 MAG: PE-PPE domain-containing protein [Mycobacterium sp.]
MGGRGNPRKRSAVLAATGSGGLVALSALTAAAAFATDDAALIMGGTGTPIPPESYIQAVNELYLHCDPPACALQGVDTPEGLYPIVGGPKELTLNQSVAQGVAILDNAIQEQLAAGNDVTVFGYSQSAVIATEEMENIANGIAGIDPSPEQLHFVMIGDPNNPNGGLLERLDLPPNSDPTVASLGITFNGATPVDDYPTAIYTGEYDGFADFPRYPIDVLADLNALLGILFVHTEYPDLTAAQLSSAVEVPTSAGYDGATTYWMIPTEYLPLLDPLRAIPVSGPILADLLQPDVEVLVNLGYGDPAYGWVNDNANVPTPAGLFPSLADLEKVPGLLVAGTEEGIQDAISDIEHPAQLFSLASNPVLRLLEESYVAAVTFKDIAISPGSDTPLGIVDALSGAASSLYGTLLPTADIINALLTTVPAEDLTIFAYELSQGNVLDAIGMPVAVNAALLPLGGLFDIIAVGEGVFTAGLDLASPFIEIPGLIP